MDHTSSPFSTPNLSGHVDKTIHLTIQITVRSVFPVFSPFKCKYTLLRCPLGHWENRVTDKGEALLLVQPGAPTATCGEKLLEKWGINDADDGFPTYYKPNGDAEHWEQMRIIDGAIQWIYTPSRCTRINEIITRCAFRVRFFSDESTSVVSQSSQSNDMKSERILLNILMMRIFPENRSLDELFYICRMARKLAL